MDFTDLEVTDEFTGSGPQRTCFPAYGYSFAGGSTEDGGGHPLFMEGLLEPDESIEALVELVLMPPPVSDELRACQAPKPILYPKSQQPPLPIGVAKIGQLAIVFVPSEVTTMSGRRMRDTVQPLLGDEVTEVVIAGYSNDYSGYITTPEEYAVQQYEGGHTLFGPWTLPAFRQELGRLARALADGSPAPGGEEQGDLRGAVESLPLGNDYDEPPTDGAFGDVTTQPETSYAPGDCGVGLVLDGTPRQRTSPGRSVLRSSTADRLRLVHGSNGSRLVDAGEVDPGQSRDSTLRPSGSFRGTAPSHQRSVHRVDRLANPRRREARHIPDDLLWKREGSRLGSPRVHRGNPVV